MKTKIVNINTGETIGNRVNKARTKANMSMQDLGNVLGVSRQYIYQIEKDICKLSNKEIERFASALNVSPNWILFGDYYVLENEKGLTVHYYQSPEDKKEINNTYPIPLSDEPYKSKLIYEQRSDELIDKVNYLTNKCEYEYLDILVKISDLLITASKSKK